MGLENEERFNGTFASVIADGTIRVRAIEGEEGAVLREGVLKDGTPFSKWEKKYTKLSGFITKIEFYEGDYGKSIWTTIDDGENKILLSLSVESNYGEDLMKKLPSVDFSKSVVIRPYAFTDDKGKTRKGISIAQDEVKIKSFFTDDDNKSINGMPIPEAAKAMDKDDWKVHYINVRKFLINYITENIITKLEKAREVEANKVVETMDIEDVHLDPETPSDIPF